MSPIPAAASLLRFLAAFGVAAVLSTGVAVAAPPAAGIEGDWITPDQSALRVAPCGDRLCIKIARLPPNNRYTTDGQNPDTQLRNRPLCGLEIGRGFHLEGTGRAEGGEIYDPESGKTYHGSMMLEGDRLLLRGYVGIKLFGRTETWTRAKDPITACGRS